MRIGAMLVDDFLDMRVLMRMAIAAHDAGLYVAGEAGSGEEALLLLDDCDPQVVVLDQTMPGLSGLETAARMRERRPHQAFVVCSAYLDDAIREQARALGIGEVLSKDELAVLPDAIERAHAASGGA